MSNVGGPDSAADYCPYVISVELGDCRKPEHQEFALPGYGEKYGKYSKCLEGKLAPQGYMPIEYTGCFELECDTGNTKVVINIGGSAIDCGSTEKGVTKTVPGMEGYFICPDYDIVCSSTIANCPNSCSGRGKCTGYNGCACLDGWTGPDCDTKCHHTCASCDGPENGDCLTCKANADLVTVGASVTGSCQCQGGNFPYDEDGSCGAVAPCSWPYNANVAGDKCRRDYAPFWVWHPQNSTPEDNTNYSGWFCGTGCGTGDDDWWHNNNCNETYFVNPMGVYFTGEPNAYLMFNSGFDFRNEFTFETWIRPLRYDTSILGFTFHRS
jgi:hypothetical protein